MTVLFIPHVRRTFVFVIAVMAISCTFLSCDSKKACDTDAVCARGEICLLSVCLVGCRTDDQCEAGKFCVGFQCVVDECLAGAVRNCYEGAKDTLQVGLCRSGAQFCQTSRRWSGCSGQNTPQSELCDKLDNDCNGKVDDVSDPKGCSCPNPGNKRSCFPGALTLAGTGLCKAGIQYCEADNQWGHCLDYVLPSQEICDGKDNDCDGKVDEDVECNCKVGDTRSCYTGTIGTLQGACQRGQHACTPTGWSPCVNEILPGPEVCDGKDNDCNGKVDDGGVCPQVEPSREPLTEPITEPLREPLTEPFTEPFTEPLREPLTEPLTEPITEPLTEPLTEPITEPLTEPLTEPIAEMSKEPKREPAPEFLGDSSQEPTRDLVQEPVVDAGREATPDVPESIPEAPSEPGREARADGGLCTSGSSRRCPPAMPQLQSGGMFACTHHKQDCVSGAWGPCQPKQSQGLVAETCDGTDNNCNGLIDDDPALSCAQTGAVLCHGQVPCVQTFAGPFGYLSNSPISRKYPFFGKITGVVFDAKASFLYLVDATRHRIWKMLPFKAVNTLSLVAFAGSGRAGADNGLGLHASFKNPQGIAVDGNANVYIADTGNNCIRKITLAGQVTTYAGTCGATQGMKDGLASAATFNGPTGLAVLGTELYVADRGNNCIRKIHTLGAQVQVDSVFGPCGATGGFKDGAVGGALFRSPFGIAVDPGTGDLYVSDQGNRRIRYLEKAAQYTVSTLAGDCTPNPCAPDYFLAGNGKSRLGKPAGLTFGPGDGLYVADELNHAILKMPLTTPGTFSLWAGSSPAQGASAGSLDGVGSTARFNGPIALSYQKGASSGSHFLYVADSINQSVRRTEHKTNMTPTVTTLAGTAEKGFDSGKTFELPSALFANPTGMLVTAAGMLIYVVDTDNHAIREIAINVTVTPTRYQVTTLQTKGSSKLKKPHGVAEGNGGLYIADTGNHRIAVHRSSAPSLISIGQAGSPGYLDGKLGSARFNRPEAIVYNSRGTLFYVADTGNNLIRTISSSDDVSTLALTGNCNVLKGPRGLFLVGSDDLYVADTGNGRVCHIDLRNGNTSTDLALMSSPQLMTPVGITVNSVGDIYVVDEGNHLVHKFSKGAGQSWSFQASTGGYFDGGVQHALFRAPHSIVVLNNDQLLVTDSQNHRIRIIYEK